MPTGTGNDFARALGLPIGDPAAAARRATDPVAALDAIRVGSTWVASVATTGFSVAVNARADRLRWPHGSARYTIATLLELRGLRSRPVTLTVDDVRHDVDAVFVTVANTSHFGGGMQISPDARPDDGVLDVTVFGPIGRVELLRVFPRVFSGTHVDHPAVAAFRGTRIRVDGEGPHWGDGEPVGWLPTTFEAVGGALLVAGAAGRSAGVEDDG